MMAVSDHLPVQRVPVLAHVLSYSFDTEEGKMPTGSSLTSGLHFFHLGLVILVFRPCKKDIPFIHRFLGRKDISNEFVVIVECYKGLVHLAVGLEKDTDLC